MNIVQLHDKILGFLDQARSGRIHPVMLDAAINTAHVTYLNQKIGSEALTQPVIYYPEESNRIKDALKFYYEDVTINTTNKEVNLITQLIVAGKPSLFLLLNVEINIGTIHAPRWISPTPINKKDGSELSQNTFLQPLNNGWATTYMNYSGGKLSFLLPNLIGLNQIRLGYLRFPVPVSFGTMINHVDFESSNTNVIISSPKALYDGYIQFRGQEFTIVNPMLFTQGEVYYGYSGVDIDPTIIDLLTPISAAIIANNKIGVFNSTEKN